MENDQKINRVNSANELSDSDQHKEITLENITIDDFVKYSGASGDFNPLHYDRDFSDDAGHDDLFAQGMLVSGFASSLITQWLGINRITSYETRFIDYSYEGEDIIVNCEIQNIEYHNSIAEVEVSINVRANDSRKVATGKATAELPIHE